MVSSLIFLSFIIFIGMGHAAIPLGFMEIFIIPSFFNSGGDLNSMYDTLFFISTLTALIAHILLFFSFLTKKNRRKIILIITGEVLLLATIIYFISGYSQNNAAKFTLGCSLPALINMVVLILYLILDRKHWATSE